MNKLLATTLVAMSGITAHGAIVTFTDGDLLLGFHAVDGQGANDTYVFNLGPATSFRDGTAASTFTVLDADLSQTFGDNWSDRTDLFWGAAAVRASAPFGAAVAGDPTRTIYVSRDADDGAWMGIGQTDRASAANDIFGGFQANFKSNQGTAASGNRGSIIPTSQNNDYAQYNPRSTTGPTAPSFGSFNPSIEATVGEALNLYRILNTNSGANPMGTVGDGTLLGTLSIGGNDAVNFLAVPEPSSAAMVMLGATLLGFARRRCKQTPTV